MGPPAENIHHPDSLHKIVNILDHATNLFVVVYIEYIIVLVCLSILCIGCIFIIGICIGTGACGTSFNSTHRRIAYGQERVTYPWCFLLELVQF